MAFQLAVTRLEIAPSEFWRMVPRHFWWLMETLKAKGPSLTGGEITEMRALLELAERGDF